MRGYYLFSRAAVEGAEQLIEDIKNGKLKVPVCLNGLNGIVERGDNEYVVSFSKFLKSKKGKILLEQLDKNM